jgi:mRNA deadenylase 3'-5' endonuclease subunit Ccr4
VKVDYFGTSLFRIVNYNITSQERIESYKEFLPKYAVQWVYRRNVLNSEILGMEGDIICLQELPSDQRKEIDLEWSKCGFSSCK